MSICIIFKEVFPGKPIRVSLQLKGISKDGMFFEFSHNFYDSEGRNVARSEMMGAWIDFKRAKINRITSQFFRLFGRT